MDPENLGPLLSEPEDKEKKTSEVDLSAASTFELVKNLYKDDLGNPFSLTPTQNEIFDCIFMKGLNVDKRRIHVMTFTQFGKSDTISMAVLTRVTVFPEKWIPPEVGGRNTSKNACARSNPPGRTR